jgi:hypothetical protein
MALDGPVAGRAPGDAVVVGAAVVDATPPDPAAVVVGAEVVGAAVVEGAGTVMLSVATVVRA